MGISLNFSGWNLSDSLWIVTLLSILGSDAIAVPLSAAFPASELRYIIDQSEAKMLLSSKKFGDKAEEVLKEGLENKPIHAPLVKIETGADPKDVSLENLSSSQGGMMLYTSGTTNRPVRYNRDPMVRCPWLNRQ